MSSPNVLKLLLMAQECGLEYRLRHVDVYRAQQAKIRLQRLAPNGKVPVLVADGEAVFESVAALIWLAEREGRFCPGTGQPLQWLIFQAASIGPMFGQYAHFFRHGAQDGYALVRYRSEVARLYRVLDTRLASNAYICGENIGLADMATWPWLRTADMMFPLFVKEKAWSYLPALRRWYDDIARRPATNAALSRFETFLPKDRESFANATPALDDRFFGTGRYDHATQLLNGSPSTNKPIDPMIEPTNA